MDLKPKKFFVKENVIELADFGLSSFGKTGEGKADTPGYTAPEVVQALSIYLEQILHVGIWSHTVRNCLWTEIAEKEK